MNEEQFEELISELRRNGERFEELSTAVHGLAEATQDMKSDMTNQLPIAVKKECLDGMTPTQNLLAAMTTSLNNTTTHQEQSFAVARTAFESAAREMVLEINKLSNQITQKATTMTTAAKEMETSISKSKEAAGEFTETVKKAAKIFDDNWMMTGVRYVVAAMIGGVAIYFAMWWGADFTKMGTCKIASWDLMMQKASEENKGYYEAIYQNTWEKQNPKGKK